MHFPKLFAIFFSGIYFGNIPFNKKVEFFFVYKKFLFFVETFCGWQNNIKTHWWMHMLRYEWFVIAMKIIVSFILGMYATITPKKWTKKIIHFSSRHFVIFSRFSCVGNMVRQYTHWLKVCFYHLLVKRS